MIRKDSLPMKKIVTHINLWAKGFRTVHKKISAKLKKAGLKSSDVDSLIERVRSQ
jgi:hypothetical protein